MLSRSLLTFLGILCCLFATAQQNDIEPLIKAWRTADTSQTHRAEETYAELKHRREVVEKMTVGRDQEWKRLLFEQQKRVSALYAWLANNPDDRLKVRITMYEILGKLELSVKRTPQDSVAIYNSVKLAHKLKDEQLKAEVYTLCAEVGRGSNRYVLYNLKALELERKIGLTHFKFVHNRFFNVSLGLYQSNNYRQSINYGLQCLSFKNTAKKTWDPRVYIFQLDVVGAAYLKLGQYDSSRYYYQQIIDTLTKKPDPVPEVHVLWLGIAKGNIGHALILQGKETEGIPLVNQQLTSAREMKSYNNMAIAQNILADLDFRNKRYSEAVAKWKLAYQWALQSEYYVIEQKLLSLKGLADSYRKLNQADSAYQYGDLYNKLNMERLSDLSSMKLSAIKAKMEFDDLQNNLEVINARLTKEKLTRNFVLGGVFLLMVITLLLYNRQRLKDKHGAEMLRQQRAAAEKEVSEARDRIKVFTHHIHEKEKLIKNLEQTIRHNNGTDAAEKEIINESLLHYVLLTDDEWSRFKEAFNKAYPIFFHRLKELIPRINPAEERLASLIGLQLNNRQIANMLGISAESVARSKRRLKKRIDLPDDVLLEDYILTLND